MARSDALNTSEAPDDQPLSWSATLVADQPHPRGQHLRAADAGRQLLLSRQLSHAGLRGAHRADRERRPDDRQCARLGAAADAAGARRQDGAGRRLRLRVYDGDGALVLDSWRAGPITYQLRDPEAEPWQKHVARFMDRTLRPHRRRRPRRRASSSPRRDRRAWPEARPPRPSPARSSRATAPRPIARRALRGARPADASARC